MRNRKKAALLIAVALAASFAAALWIAGCGQVGHKSAPQVAQPSATGDGYYYGNRIMAEWKGSPPNDAAYDSMFFKHYGINPFIDTDDENRSTFAVDVDTGSYTVCKRYLNDGNVPPEEAARVEEFLNYFDYRYKPPSVNAFEIYLEGAPSQFGRDGGYHLLRIGIKGKEISAEERKKANLVFVIDTSGSMGMETRLELVKKALRLLVDQLRPSDRIGIVEYGSRARKVLDPTTVEHKEKIIGAIESLKPNGSTNAEEGIVMGYEMAEKISEKNAINRVILCSDGVANVGNTGPESIYKKIEEKVQKGIFLSAVGFGMGNYNDVLMEQLGDKGNGHYAYVDTIDDAQRIFVANLNGTLQVIAKDVKVQVEFNSDVVARYRLIGYENRRVDNENFRNDKVDGGEIGAGHSVTALYEIKFQKGAEQGRVATVFIRYKDPDSDEVSEVKREITTNDFARAFDAASADFRLAAGVAEFAEILRKCDYAKKSEFSDVMPVLTAVLKEHPDDDDVIELLNLVAKANKLSPGEVEIKEKDSSAEPQD